MAKPHMRSRPLNHLINSLQPDDIEDALDEEKPCRFTRSKMPKVIGGKISGRSLGRKPVKPRVPNAAKQGTEYPPKE